MHQLKGALFVLILFSSTKVLSQEAVQPNAPKLMETVTVTAGSTSVPATFRDLERAVEYFNDHKKKAAPAAILKFQVTVPEATLFISDDVNTEQIELDPANLFKFDDIPRYLNGVFYVDKERAKIRPWVRSLTDENTIRVGDIRMECLLTWEIIKDSAPVKVKLYLSANGGFCGYKKLSYTYGIQKPISSAEINDSGKIRKAQLSRDGMNVIVPIQDKNLTDNAVITIKVR